MIKKVLFKISLYECKNATPVKHEIGEQMKNWTLEKNSQEQLVEKLQEFVCYEAGVRCPVSSYSQLVKESSQTKPVQSNKHRTTRQTNSNTSMSQQNRVSIRRIDVK